MLGLGLVRGGLVVRGYINCKEDVTLWNSRVSYYYKGRPRRSISSAKQRKGQRVCSAIQSDNLGSSVDKDIHCDHTGQNGSWEISREICYHRIKCSVTNSLTALMRKWYLNSAFQPYSYPQRLQESTDRTKINTSNLMSTWGVEMRGERWYKIGGRS